MGLEALALIGSAVAIVGTVANLLYTRRADGRAREALSLAKNADERDRDRHEREMRADLEIVAAMYAALPPHRNRRYRAHLRNLGAAAARRVRVWIVDGENETPIGLLASSHYPADLTIEPGGDATVDLELGASLVSNLLRFQLSWTDGTGDWLADGPMCPKSTEMSKLVRWSAAKPPRLGTRPEGV